MTESTSQKNLHILAHRGVCNTVQEHNSLMACERAFAQGFGIEVDVRDDGGTLVVAHNPGEKTAYPFAQLQALAQKYPQRTMAINIKSSGLQSLLGAQLPPNYFTFDMAVPDLLANMREGITSFTRHSDYEPEPVMYNQAHGVWLDMFTTDWLTRTDLETHAKAGKAVAIVSPELHRRPHLPFWEQLKAMLPTRSPATLYLCTDHPQDAETFFHG